MYWAASFPVRRGSSEKDSKFLPPSGCLCIQTVGARSTLADRALVSSARCCPTSWSRSLFHVAANEIPQGKRAAWGVCQLAIRRGVPFLAHLGSANKDSTAGTVGSVTRLDCWYIFGRNRLRPPEIGSSEQGNLHSSQLSLFKLEGRHKHTVPFPPVSRWTIYSSQEALGFSRVETAEMGSPETKIRCPASYSCLCCPLGTHLDRYREAYRPHRRVKRRPFQVPAFLGLVPLGFLVSALKSPG